MVAQHVEQRGIGVGGDADGVSVYGQRDWLHHSSRRQIEETISDCSVEGWWTMHVLICGGGVIGAATAYFLSCRGARATVIERTGLACAASGKAGGFLAQAWCDRAPLQALARRSFALHAELAQRVGGDWGYRRLATY